MGPGTHVSSHCTPSRVWLIKEHAALQPYIALSPSRTLTLAIMCSRQKLRLELQIVITNTVSTFRSMLSALPPGRFGDPFSRRPTAIRGGLFSTA